MDRNSEVAVMRRGEAPPFKRETLTMQQSEQERIFDDWLAKHKNVLFKVVHAYAFTPHDRDDLFQEIITQMWNSIPRFRLTRQRPSRT